MEGATRFPRIHLARNGTFMILFFALLLAGCDGTGETEAPETESLPVNAVESSVIKGSYEETLTAFLDRDGSDGYAGDYVLVYRPVLEEGSKPMGTLDGLVETTTNQIPFRDGTYLQTSGIYNEADPYLTDEIRQADLCYDLTDGELWQVGFQRVFYIKPTNETREMLFVVSAVGERCRVWSPVNPAYGPLEGIDPSWPEQLAREMDAAIPVLERAFGELPDIRGDGKMNILCYDFNLSGPLGLTAPQDLFDEISVDGQTLRGNSLPIVHFNTASLIQGTYSELSEIYTCVVHEMAHSISMGKSREQDSENGYVVWSHNMTLFNEFLAVAAQEVVYPGSSIHHTLPWWYLNRAVWEDLAADDADVYLRNPGNDHQCGKSMFQYNGARENYAVMLLLAHFAENRGGSDTFAQMMDHGYTNLFNWVADLWERLGYEDYPAFVEDFLLSILLHEEDGPYRLHPFEGYDPAFCDGDENPFSHLVPIITDKGLYIRGGGYAVLKPVGGVYYPPAAASKDLCYVGITLKAAG